LKENATNTNQLAEHFFRHSYAKLVAILVNYFGLPEVEIAEDIVQDTLVEAMENWSIRSIPDHPEAWLMDVAKKKTINLLKRNQLYQNKVIPSLERTNLDSLEFSEKVEKNSTLKMIFTCCHPALPDESQIALALKSLCGLSIPEIASALLAQPATINKRLYRAKQKFRDHSIPFEIPTGKELGERLDNVFATLYLLFNEGYYSSHNPKMIRIDLCYEAIRLLKQVLENFKQAAEAKALLALMLLNIARFESRMDQQGVLIILEKQDRSLWDRGLIAQGIEYLKQSIAGKKVTKFQLQAGIAAEHCIAASFETTNWTSISRQYAILEQLDDNALVKLNLNIARFYAGEQKKALQQLLAQGTNPTLQKSVHYHSTLAVFYLELKLKAKAIPYLETALALSTSTKEKELIRKKMEI